MMWAKAVRDARRRLGLNQTQLASLLGTRQATISDWERGKYEPADEMKAQLVAKCGVDPKDVVPEWLRPVLLGRAA